MTKRSCSPGWFKSDPNVEPLRRMPSVKNLVGGGKGRRARASGAGGDEGKLLVRASRFLS
jgi:hypothetical protein